MKTPQLPAPNLANAIGIPELYLKREDMHHFGSHKGRSIPFMIDQYRKEGVNNFVISSSGNAALAAMLAVQTHNANSERAPLTLKVYVGKKISAEKLSVLHALLNDRHVSIEQVENPKQQAFQMDKEKKAKNLRQSTDDTALLGYKELAQEISHIPNLSAVFIPTSSGTTAQALGETFHQAGLNIQIHVAQTTACHPIADNFDTAFTATETSIASAIVDHVAHRKQAVVNSIKQSNGSGWVISDKEISYAMNLIEDTEHLAISPNSALSIAGLLKAKQTGWSWNGPVLCLITGR